MSYIVIYEENGRISSFFTGPTSVLSEAQESFENSLLLDREPLPDEYVDNGAIESMGDAPSQHHVFSFDQKQWQYNLEGHKTATWQDVKAARTSQEFGTFDWGGYTFQCDEVSQRRIQGAVQLAGIDSTMTLDWTLADNTVQTFTAAEYVQIGQALANHVSQCHERGRILRQQIQSATTEAELEAIVW